MAFQVLLLICICGALLVPFASWRSCVFAALVALVLEGALRKWFFSSAGEALFFLKDLILAIAYAKYLRRKERSFLPKKIHQGVRIMCALNVTYLTLEVCNYNLGSPVVGFFGFKNYAMYLPLLFMVQELFRSEKAILKFSNLYLLIVIPSFAVALLQYRSPPSSRINQYASVDENSIPGTGVATAGGKTRATGTFPYISGFSGYLCANLALLFPLIIRRGPRNTKLLYLGALLLILACMLMTGARGSLAFGALFTLLYCALNPAARTDRGLGAIFGGLAIVGIVSLSIFPDQWTSLMSRFETKGQAEFANRFKETGFLGIANYVSSAGLFGYGIGATYQAVGTIRSRFGLPPGTPIPIALEEEQGRIMIELGLLGYILWTALRLTIILALYRSSLYVKNPFYRDIGVSALVFQILALFSPTVFTASNGIFAWFFAGFLFLILRLDALESRASQGVAQR